MLQYKNFPQTNMICFNIKTISILSKRVMPHANNITNGILKFEVIGLHFFKFLVVFVLCKICASQILSVICSERYFEIFLKKLFCHLEIKCISHVVLHKFCLLNRRIKNDGFLMILS